MKWMCVALAMAACGKGDGGGAASNQAQPPTGEGATTRAQCLAVRDHVVQLISSYYVAHPDQTWDGLDRTDPAVNDGLDPGMTKDNFATFLASEPGQAWLARARARTVAGAAMTETVDKCVKGATKEHLDCWMGATSIEMFQTCPNP